MKSIIIIMSLLIAGCASKSSDLTRPVDVNIDSSGRIVSAKINGAQYMHIQSQKTDAIVAKEISECWAEVSKQANQLQILPGMTTEQILLISMVNLNSTMAQALNRDKVVPCNFGANSNDALIARENGKTSRSAIRWNVAPKILGIAAAGVAGVKAIDAFTGLATAGLNAAGNRTTVTGDDNHVNTTSQDADNGSTITESGNYNEAGGIPVNQTDLQIAAAPEEGFEGEAGSEFTSQCTDLGGNVRPATPEEIAAGIGSDGFACSDGNGGTIEF